MKELKNQKIWIPYLNHNGKKPSLDGRRYAKWSNRSILLYFKDAVNLQTRTPGLTGIGFVIPPGYVVIDIDNCITDNKPNKISKGLLKKFNSYSEISPSGRSIHIIPKSTIKCKKLRTRIDGQSVEFLTPGSFCTFTNNVLVDNDIRDCTNLIKEFYPAFPAFRPNTPVGVEGGYIRDSTAYGRAALSGECSKIREATVGNRTNTLLKGAFRMGCLIPGGFVNEFRAIHDLEIAGRATGLPEHKVRKTITDGIEEGKKHPRNIKNKK